MDWKRLCSSTKIKIKHSHKYKLYSTFAEQKQLSENPNLLYVYILYFIYCLLYWHIFAVLHWNTFLKSQISRKNFAIETDSLRQRDDYCLLTRIIRTIKYWPISVAESRDKQGKSQHLTLLTPDTSLRRWRRYHRKRSSASIK